MARIKVAQQDGFIQLFDGTESHVYRVKNGEIEVAEGHAEAVIASVAGSSLIVPEAPAKSAKPEAPAKEK